MRTFKALRGVGVAACLAVGLLLLLTVSGAMALKVCVPTKEGAAIKQRKLACAPRPPHSLNSAQKANKSRKGKTASLRENWRS